jgi:shikimate kinase
MRMANTGGAVAHGAITVINAISCGFGAALGVDLKTEALVRLTDEPGRIEGSILSDLKEDTLLIEKTVSRVLNNYGLEKQYGAYVETKSDIPIARGLKSSSAAANAITLAALNALREELDDLAAVNMGVDAALEAGVTITGAFDDACASYFGNIVVTDNFARKILERFYPDEEHPILIHVPSAKSYTAKSNVQRMKLISDEIKALHGMALQGEYWAAMTLNGLLYSIALGYDTKVAMDALSAGALAAGLSGTGPAVAAVVPRENVESVTEAWKVHGGRIIKTQINTEKAYRVQ